MGTSPGRARTVFAFVAMTAFGAASGLLGLETIGIPFALVAIALLLILVAGRGAPAALLAGFGTGYAGASAWFGLECEGGVSFGACDVTWYAIHFAAGLAVVLAGAVLGRRAAKLKAAA